MHIYVVCEHWLGIKFACLNKPVVTKYYTVLVNSNRLEHSASEQTACSRTLHEPNPGVIIPLFSLHSGECV